MIRSVLSRPALLVVARVLLTFPFWGSGLAKLIDFQGGTAEMAMFGLHPPAVINAVVALTQLTGSALIIANRAAWLGAGALGVFTALTIPIVHHFWSLDGERGIVAFHTATEHVGMIGGLILAAILAERGAGTASPLSEHARRGG
ncbi:DoxX family protein [Roseomonas haemaphysalidis]|uniref:DoxX family protein n=1 Tax=Roseomonas haemaphysalidis TaxID=2768162 RepID=A0ABS3KRV9_9PROT|nr:DoxX family protein [Roseomonas haemaphysalidis]MBO1080215.1 DoxX family protein [Roseomonas haemaphysalidis]